MSPSQEAFAPSILAGNPSSSFCPIAVRFGLLEQIIAQPQHSQASLAVFPQCPMGVENDSTSVPPAPLCPPESSHHRPLPKEGNASTPPAPATVCRRPGRREGSPRAGLLRSRLPFFGAYPIVHHHRPLAGPACPNSNISSGLYSIFSGIFHSLGGDRGRRSLLNVNVGRWVTGPIIPDTSLNNDMVPKSPDRLPRASDGAVMHEPPASVPPAQQLISQKPWVTPSPLEQMPCSHSLFDSICLSLQVLSQRPRDQPPELASAKVPQLQG